LKVNGLKVLLYFLKKIQFIKKRRNFQSALLGTNSVIFKNCFLQNSIIGSYTYVQTNSTLINVQVGKFCSIASNVHIGLFDHPLNRVSTSPVFYDNSQPLPFFFTSTKTYNSTNVITFIQDDVWIGHGSLVLAGVNIGVGAVVGAGAVVTKNVDPYSVVVGVPAKHIKFRFEPEVRERLLKSEWWKLDENTLMTLAPFMIDPVVFLAELEKLTKEKFF
jgi:acetyltransferase-like isoleucine patch superfamily enzyme